MWEMQQFVGMQIVHHENDEQRRSIDLSRRL